MSFSNVSLDSYNNFMTTSSFTDLLNFSVNTDAEVFGNRSLVDCPGFGFPKLKSLSPPSIPISPSLDSPSSYFAFPPGLSPTDLLDSPVLSSSNVLPSPTAEAFVTNNMDVIDMNKYSNFKFQTQARPNNNDVSSTMFQSSMPSYTNEQGLRGEENQQQSWVFGDENKQDDQSLNSIKTMVKSEFTIESYSQANTVKYDEQDQNSTFQPAQYIRDKKTSNDGYNWRKYGQKQVKGSENPRSYYKCTFPNCSMRKKIETSLEGHIIEIVYKGSHKNHPKPINNRRSSSFSSTYQTCVPQSNALHDQLSLVQQRSSSGQMDYLVATHDNLSISMVDEEVDMGYQSHRCRSVGDDFDDDDEPQAKRWRAEVENECMSAAPGNRAVREPRIVVQTTSDIDILDDGYRWRKYGQKVVKSNPNPRSYYKCTHPSCPVRKHVERAAHDLKAVITTYEGKHNHDVPAARGSGMSRSSLGPNNGGMSLMDIRPSAGNYIGSNPGNGHTFQGNQRMASIFEEAGQLSPFTLQLLQNPGSFGFSEYLNQPQYSENNSIFSNTSITTNTTY